MAEVVYKEHSGNHSMPLGEGGEDNEEGVGGNESAHKWSSAVGEAWRILVL